MFPPSVPPAPTNVKVAAGDTVATVTWDMAPGVTYFAYWAPGGSLTPESCGSNPLCLAQTNVTSPLVISNLTDGSLYSITINGRVNGGPGGVGSPSIQVTPRQAGSSGLWTTGNSLGGDLYGLTYGSIYSSAGASLGYGFVATGVNGALMYSIDGINWTSILGPSTSATLYGIANTGATFVVVGAAGTMLYSSNYTESWTQYSSPTAYDLYAIYGYAGGLFVAAGQNGTVLTSATGASSSWTVRNSNTTNTLRSVVYGNGLYVAVGDAGTLLTSSDAVTWTVNASVPSQISSANLEGVTYGYVYSAVTGAWTPTFVAVGANGVVLTSTDNGTTWVLGTLPSAQLNAVAFGARAIATDGQFVIVDNVANVFTSPDGVTWTNQNLAAGSPLYNVISGQYDYSAVGAGGLNMHSM